MQRRGSGAIRALQQPALHANAARAPPTPPAALRSPHAPPALSRPHSRRAPRPPGTSGPRGAELRRGGGWVPPRTERHSRPPGSSLLTPGSWPDRAADGARGAAGLALCVQRLPAPHKESGADRLPPGPASPTGCQHTAGPGRAAPCGGWSLRRGAAGERGRERQSLLSACVLL